MTRTTKAIAELLTSNDHSVRTTKAALQVITIEYRNLPRPVSSFGGFELYLNIENTEGNFWIDTNIGIEAGAYASIIVLESVPTGFNMWIYSSGGAYSSNKIFYPCDIEAQKTIRIVFASRYMSVWVDDQTVHTWYFTHVNQPENIQLGMRMSIPTNASYTNCELFAVRDGIYFEPDSSGFAAISSVIQERPVFVTFISPHYVDTNMIGDSVAFFYRVYNREEIYANFIVSHRRQKGDGGFSSALLYYIDVAVVQDIIKAGTIGYRNRLLRVPNLEDDAVYIAQFLMDEEFRARLRHDVTCRLDPSIDLRDKVILDYNISATDTHVLSEVLPKSITTEISSGVFQMNITGTDT